MGIRARISCPQEGLNSHLVHTMSTDGAPFDTHSRCDCLAGSAESDWTGGRYPALWGTIKAPVPGASLAT